MKQTLKEAGYTYIHFYGQGLHLLCDSNGILEFFMKNKNHASWGLKYKNTHLEFLRSLNRKEI